MKKNNLYLKHNINVVNKTENLNIKIIPIISYYNVDKCKDIIYKENKNKSAIYRWVNNINNKSYIGSAVNLSNRLKTYFSINTLKKILTKESSMIYKAILKYNYSNFRLEILEYCKKDVLLGREQYYIDNLNPEYNILKFAGSRVGHKMNFNTKMAISIALRSRSVLNKFELKDNIPKSNLSLRGWNNGISVKIFDSSNNFLNQFSDMKTAAKYIGVSKNTIYKIYKTNISYDNYIYIFEKKDFRIWIYDSNYKLIKVLDNVNKVSFIYNIPKSTLSLYIRSGKIYKNKYYFYNVKNNPHIIK